MHPRYDNTVSESWLWLEFFYLHPSPPNSHSPPWEESLCVRRWDVETSMGSPLSRDFAALMMFPLFTSSTECFGPLFSSNVYYVPSKTPLYHCYQPTYSPRIIVHARWRGRGLGWTNSTFTLYITQWHIDPCIFCSQRVELRIESATFMLGQNWALWLLDKLSCIQF